MKSIIFDMDGTLIDSDEGIFKAFKKALDLLNVPVRKNITENEIHNCYGGTLKTYIDNLVEPSYNTPELINTITSKMSYVYNGEFIKENTPVFDGIQCLLKELKKQNIILGIVSNSHQYILEIICDMFFDGIFDYIYGDDEHHKTKPDTSGIQGFLDEFNLKTDDVALIGDTPTDYQTATKIGIKIIGASWNINSLGTQTLVNMKCCPIAKVPNDVLDLLKLNK